MIAWVILLIVLIVLSFSKSTTYHDPGLKFLCRVTLGLYIFGSVALYFIG